MSIALVDDQRLVWAEGFGFADATKGIAADPATVYHVGSITKLFTTLGALQLTEQDRLDIDQPIQRYLPGFSIKSHAVGQTTDHPAPAHDPPCGTAPRHPAGHVDRPTATVRPASSDLLQDEYQAYPPDTLFAYSNLGMTLLGHDRAGGRRPGFRDKARRPLLRPLGMTDAYFATGQPRRGTGCEGL